jgi:redox-sensitive bicupin YhaK (pirin superfamily)
MTSPTTRAIVHKTRGQGLGPIVRLMSPSDLGEHLKPFVFLDLFEADMRGLAGGMPVHPHSGIATVTALTEGDVTFDDPQAGHGTIGYGGVEFVRAGGGMWHGRELSAGRSEMVQGFQLWIALPPELELADLAAQYVVTEQIPAIGPARVLVGSYAGATSPVRAPRGINYLLLSLRPGERWTYDPPGGHGIAWIAVARGALIAGERVSAGELAVFENGETPFPLESAPGVGATLVLGSAVPHPYPLHLGSYSVHTSAEALAAGELRIRELGQRLEASGDRRTEIGSTPVFRG